MEEKSMSKSLGKRINWNQLRWMWGLVITALAIIGAAATGCNKQGHGVPSGAVTAGKVAADGAFYYGKQIQIYGYVSNPSVGAVFLISDAIGGTVSLPVVVKGANVAVTLGEWVLIDGTPTAFDAGRLKQDYGIDLPAGTTRGWENRPVVVAQKVQKLD
jgi:hypothetical protein